MRAKRRARGKWRARVLVKRHEWVHAWARAKRSARVRAWARAKRSEPVRGTERTERAKRRLRATWPVRSHGVGLSLRRSWDG